MFSFIISLYNNGSPKLLPTHIDMGLCNLFSDLYINKLSDICYPIPNKLLVLDTPYSITWLSAK